MALNLKFNSFVPAPEVAGLKQVYFVLRALRSELIAGRHYTNNLVLGALVLELCTKVRQFYPLSTELVEVLRSHSSGFLLGQGDERPGVGTCGFFGSVN